MYLCIKENRKMFTILSLSPSHIIITLVILLLLFGGKKIPELMKGLGSGIKEFKDAVKEEDKEASSKNKEENKE